ncbi:penicillin-binding protein [Bacillus massiliglaciei]|uniref:penicillin-binding protein n=1 Tax=Bacillus massiliglaciei TaxID=1816693 RepID=UPI000AF3A98C|nr:penicillin-binding protein [Bacillus massiliglaciei]
MQKQKNMKYGAAGLFFLFGLLFFVLIGRFLYIQLTGVAGGEVLAAKIDKKYEKEQVIEGKRGNILDTNGEIIAEDTSSYLLRAVLNKQVTTNPKHPNHVVDPEKTAEELAKYIDMDEADILERLKDKDAFQVEFGKAGRDLSQDTKQKIEKLELPGITFERSNKRFYPNGVFASHLIGYVEKDEETEKMTGKFGIERYLNKELEEKDGKLTYDSDRWGFLLPNSETKVDAPKNGKNVTLTIDKKIQTFLEDSLSKVDEKYKPEQMVAIIANPKTGEIVAMGQRPTFHPTTKEGLSDTWRNLAIEDSFEPGSTMKTFTLAAAVEEGVFNPNDTFKAGTYKVGVEKINDHSGIEKGKTMTFLEGVQRSSNVAFATLAMDKIGADKFREYLTKFGFDKKTGIDLPNEIIGKILFKYKMEKVTTAFGQGTSVTPIQQVQAATAIANDGKMMKPYVIKNIADQDTGKLVKSTKPEIAGEPISAETAKQVREYLGTVITAEHGTGAKYKLDGYEVAGKTGTAQIPGPGGKYLTGKNNYVFSFLGMAPKDNPQLVMYVAVKQPKLGVSYVGADPLSEIFNPVMQNSLQYLNIKPSNVKKIKTEKVKDYTSQSVNSTVEELKEEGYNPVVIGDEKRIINQSPKPGNELLQGEKIILRTEGDMKIPDMKGWSLRDVMKAVNAAGLELETSGSGFVTKQNIKAGKAIKEGDHITIELKPPGEISENKKE